MKLQFSTLYYHFFQQSFFLSLVNLIPAIIKKEFACKLCACGGRISDIYLVRRSVHPPEDFVVWETKFPILHSIQLRKQNYQKNLLI